MLTDLHIRLRSLLRRGKVEKELDEELRFHIDRQLEKYVRAGMNREEALRRVRLEFGGIDQVKEDCRQARGVTLLESLIQDAQYALRALRRNPGFSAVVLVTLALGIGANTAIFTVVDGIMLRPLPYPRSHEIVHFGWMDKSLIPNLSVPEFQFCRDHATSFTAIAGWRGSGDVQLNQGTTKRWVTAALVTDGLFDVLGVRFELGHGVDRQYILPGGGYAAVLTDAMWRNAFGADPHIIGRQIVMDNQSYNVTGVLPPRFTFIEPAARALALSRGSLGEELRSKKAHFGLSAEKRHTGFKARNDFRVQSLIPQAGREK